MKMLAGWLWVGVLALLAAPPQEGLPSYRALKTYADFELRLYDRRPHRPHAGEPRLSLGSTLASRPYAASGFSQGFVLPTSPPQEADRLLAVSRCEPRQLLSAVRRVGLVPAGEVRRSPHGESLVEVLEGYGGPPTPLSQGPLG